ncbi:hypothetical protein HYH03_008554 [Edaphochlamys debaryana]|uniref:RAP domain-containing protein n=1 Tax=Edaphochlamys debaryana TaxID=47281 RepID=A0A835XXX1_9CHLO|nr:hypothetical protein HYH03_008554 [Edaphochlamys debaryana]|eukprot:KAG2493127.1 hypothetical protein HYH03_008554 [Edaphochlamys debaryana]
MMPTPAKALAFSGPLAGAAAGPGAGLATAPAFPGPTRRTLTASTVPSASALHAPSGPDRAPTGPSRARSVMASALLGRSSWAALSPWPGARRPRASAFTAGPPAAAAPAAPAAPSADGSAPSAARQRQRRRAVAALEAARGGDGGDGAAGSDAEVGSGGRGGAEGAAKPQSSAQRRRRAAPQDPIPVLEPAKEPQAQPQPQGRTRAQPQPHPEAAVPAGSKPAAGAEPRPSGPPNAARERLRKAVAATPKASAEAPRATAVQQASLPAAAAAGVAAAEPGQGRAGPARKEQRKSGGAAAGAAEASPAELKQTAEAAEAPAEAKPAVAAAAGSASRAAVRRRPKAGPVAAEAAGTAGAEAAAASPASSASAAFVGSAPRGAPSQRMRAAKRSAAPGPAPASNPASSSARLSGSSGVRPASTSASTSGPAAPRGSVFARRSPLTPRDATDPARPAQGPGSGPGGGARAGPRGPNPRVFSSPWSVPCDMVHFPSAYPDVPSFADAVRQHAMTWHPLTISAALNHVVHLMEATERLQQRLGGGGGGAEAARGELLRTMDRLQVAFEPHLTSMPTSRYASNSLWVMARTGHWAGPDGGGGFVRALLAALRRSEYRLLQRATAQAHGNLWWALSEYADSLQRGGGGRQGAAADASDDLLTDDDAPAAAAAAASPYAGGSASQARRRQSGAEAAGVGDVLAVSAARVKALPALDPEDYEPQELANILLGAARLGVRDDELVGRLGAAFVRHPGPFKPQAVSNFVWSLGELYGRDSLHSRTPDERAAAAAATEDASDDGEEDLDPSSPSPASPAPTSGPAPAANSWRPAAEPPCSPAWGGRDRESLTRGRGPRLSALEGWFSFRQVASLALRLGLSQFKPQELSNTAYGLARLGVRLPDRDPSSSMASTLRRTTEARQAAAKEAAGRLRSEGVDWQDDDIFLSDSDDDDDPLVALSPPAPSSTPSSASTSTSVTASSPTSTPAPASTSTSSSSPSSSSPFARGSSNRGSGSRSSSGSPAAGAVSAWGGRPPVELPPCTLEATLVFVRKLARHVRRRLQVEPWGAQALANSAWAFASVNYPRMPLYRQLVSHTLQEGSMALATPQEWSIFCWSLATVRYQPPRLLLQRLKAALMQPEPWGGTEPMTWSTLLWSFAVLNMYDADLITWMVTVGDFTHLQEEQNVTNVLWALATMPEGALARHAALQRQLLRVVERRWAAGEKPNDVGLVQLWQLHLEVEAALAAPAPAPAALPPAAGSRRGPAARAPPPPPPLRRLPPDLAAWARATMLRSSSRILSRATTTLQADVSATVVSIMEEGRVAAAVAAAAADAAALGRRRRQGGGGGGGKRRGAAAASGELTFESDWDADVSPADAAATSSSAAADAVLRVVAVEREWLVDPLGTRVDLAVWLSDGRLLAVEVDGPSHYMRNSYTVKLARTILRDRQLARVFGYDNVRCVPYWDWDVRASREARMEYMRAVLGVGGGAGGGGVTAPTPGLVSRTGLQEPQTV